MQLLLVLFFIALATAYAGWRLYHALTAKTVSCPDCPGCAAKCQYANKNDRAVRLNNLHFLEKPPRVHGKPPRVHGKPPRVHGEPPLENGIFNRTVRK